MNGIWNDIYLNRLLATEKEILGFLTYFDGFQSVSFNTLELPWLNNKRMESCIPPGVYRWRRYFSPHRQFEVVLLEDVPGRDMIDIHPASYVHQLKGCIAPGVERKDINGDGQIDMYKSRKAFDALMAALPQHGYIHIDDSRIVKK